MPPRTQPGPSRPVARGIRAAGGQYFPAWGELKMPISILAAYSSGASRSGDDEPTYSQAALPTEVVRLIEARGDSQRPPPRPAYVYADRTAYFVTALPQRTNVLMAIGASELQGAEISERFTLGAIGPEDFGDLAATTRIVDTLRSALDLRSTTNERISEHKTCLANRSFSRLRRETALRGNLNETR